jgi:hypothetical protein
MCLVFVVKFFYFNSVIHSSPQFIDAFSLHYYTCLYFVNVERPSILCFVVCFAAFQRQYVSS